MALFGSFKRKREDEESIETTPPVSGTERYRAVGLTFIPAGFENVLVSRSGGKPVLLSSYAAECLSRCSVFATIEEHAERIDRELRLGAYQRQDLLAQLEELREEGLLASYGDFIKDWPPAASASGGAPIDAVGIVTADRVASAERALAGLMDNARSFGREAEWTIYDDSAEASVRSEYRSMLSAMKAARGGRIRYAGTEEKTAYAKALADAGLDRPLVDFCLFGAKGYRPTYGANCNARSLDTVGSLYLGFDDDIICRIGRAPDARGGLELRQGDPTEFRFFADREAATNSYDPENPDLLALHESLLGRPIRNSGPMKDADGVAELVTDLASDRLIRAFAAGSGRIAATMMGIAGDSGMRSTLYYLTLDGDSRERLHADPDAYRSLISSRSVLRSVRRMTIGDGSWFMNYAFGMDNRRLLPPFFPVFRNCDGLVGTMLPIADPDSFFGYLPQVMAHDPPVARAETASGLMASGSDTYFIDFLVQVVGSFQTAGFARDDAPDRLRAVGRYLRSLGSMQPTDFTDFASQIVWRDKANVITSLEHILKIYDEQPEEWAADVSACLEDAKAAITARETIVPREFDGLGEEEALGLMRDFIRRFGELLAAWPDFIEAAKALRERGIRLSTPI